jgi:hypothetical protein
MRTKLLKLALAVTLSSATLIANAAPAYNTLTILESAPDWGIPNLATYTSLSRPDGENIVATAWDINDSGAIAGYIAYGSSAAPFAALWATSSSPYTQLLSLGGDGKEGNAWAINNSGSIVGYSQNADNVWKATLWSQTSLTPYSPTQLQSTFGADKSAEALAINDSGQIVGMSINSISTDYLLPRDATAKATLWDGASAIDLNTYLDTSNNLDGWVLNAAWRIDNDGSIYGTAFKQGIGDKYFSLQSVNPVPEADTSAMLLMGVGVMGFMARRRKQAAA